jgi:hypothetical protein
VKAVRDDELQALADYYDQTDTSAETADAEWDEEISETPMVTTSLRLPKPLLDRIREAAIEEDLKPSMLMRRWLEQRLDNRQTEALGKPEVIAILEAIGNVGSKVEEVASAVHGGSPSAMPGTQHPRSSAAPSRTAVYRAKKAKVSRASARTGRFTKKPDATAQHTTKEP